jgi:hypothetical protein
LPFGSAKKTGLKVFQLIVTLKIVSFWQLKIIPSQLTIKTNSVPKGNVIAHCKSSEHFDDYSLLQLFFKRHTSLREL